MKHHSLFAACESDHVSIRMLDGKHIKIHNTKDWEAFCQIHCELLLSDIPFMCSSSLDWPRDQTNNLDVIKVCNAIRGNSVK